MNRPSSVDHTFNLGCVVSAEPLEPLDTLFRPPRGGFSRPCILIGQNLMKLAHVPTVITRITRGHVPEEITRTLQARSTHENLPMARTAPQLHQAAHGLNRKTQAEEAGIRVEGNDKWMTLIHEQKLKPLERAIVVLVVVSAIAVLFVFLAPVHQFSYEPCNESSTCPHWSISVSESISCWTGAEVGSTHAMSVFWLRSDLSKYHLGRFLYQHKWSKG